MLGLLTKHLKHQCVDVLYLTLTLMPRLHASRVSVTWFIPCRKKAIALFTSAISDVHSGFSSANWKRRWAVFTVKRASAFSKQTFTMSDMTDWHLYVFVIHWRWKPSFLYKIPLDCSLSHPHSDSLTLHADFKNRTLPQSPEIARSYLWTGPQIILCFILYILSFMTVTDWWLNIIM